jgi:threonine dehydratase
VRSTSPNARIVGVEPVGFDDTRQSLAAGRRISIAGDADTLCDALMTPAPGAVTFAVNRRLMAAVLVVDEADVAEAVRFAFRQLRLVLEPSGAVALAALLAGKVADPGECLAVVLSGGNVDPAAFGRLIQDQPGNP